VFKEFTDQEEKAKKKIFNDVDDDKNY